jgi:purine catabolism regulator
MVGCDLFVVDSENGRSVIPDIPPAPTEVFRALRTALERRLDPMPAILRLDTARQLAVAVPVPTSRSTALIAAVRKGNMPQTSILHHIAAVSALEVEKLAAEYERKRQLGSELLAGLADRRLATDLAEHLLAERQLSGEPRLIAACPGDVGKNEHSDLHLRLEDRGVPHLLLRRTPVLTALLPAASEKVNAFREEVGPAFPVGLSDPVGNLSRVPDAYREAQWALQSAIATNKAVMKYGEESALSPFLPRTLNDARHIVEHILGPLLEYDAANDSQLVVSLKTLLSNQRSWQRAAESLHVHRQTLVYRMRRVEELTGRRLDETDDVAELWLALRAAEYCGDANIQRQ